MLEKNDAKTFRTNFEENVIIIIVGFVCFIAFVAFCRHLTALSPPFVLNFLRFFRIPASFCGDKIVASFGEDLRSRKWKKWERVFVALM